MERIVCDNAINKHIRDHFSPERVRFGVLQRCKPNFFEHMLIEYFGERVVTANSNYPAQCRLRLPQRRVDSNSSYKLPKG